MEKAGLVQTKKVHHPNPLWAQLWEDKALVSTSDELRVQNGTHFGPLSTPAVC